jgi:hypothetical protein
VSLEIIQVEEKAILPIIYRGILALIKTHLVIIIIIATTLMAIDLLIPKLMQHYINDIHEYSSYVLI